MKRCQIIKADTHYDLEDKINQLLKSINVISIDISSNSWSTGRSIFREYVACILYEE